MRTPKGFFAAMRRAVHGLGRAAITKRGSAHFLSGGAGLNLSHATGAELRDPALSSRCYAHLLLRSNAKSARIAMPGFRSHELALGRPLGLSRLGLFRPLADLSQKPHLTADPAAAPNKGGRPKAEAPKVHIGFRLAADVVESLKASGPGYNRPRRRGAARGRVWREGFSGGKAARKAKGVSGPLRRPQSAVFHRRASLPVRTRLMV